MLASVLSSAAIGSPGTVSRNIEAFVEATGADELMITCNMFEHSARLRSYELLAGITD